MNLLAILGQYEIGLNTPDAHQYFGYEITNFIGYYDNGIYDMAVDSLRNICDEINNFVECELICDFSLEASGCVLQLANGEEVQIM